MPAKPSSDPREVTGRSSDDLDLVRELAKILGETGLSEIEISQGERTIRVARQLAPVNSFVSAGPAPAMAATSAPALRTATEMAAADASHPGAVTSPMVGAVYVAPEPGAPPFVKVGDTVSEGQTLLIIEAMKTMNPIRAPHAGKVSRILIENGAPVEYGEVLMIVE